MSLTLRGPCAQEATSWALSNEACACAPTQNRFYRDTGYDVDIRAFCRQVRGQELENASSLCHPVPSHAATNLCACMPCSFAQNNITYQSFWTLTANPKVVDSPTVAGIASKLGRTKAQVRQHVALRHSAGSRATLHHS